MLRGEGLAEQDVVVLTPSRLRLDSRVVFAHATLQWLTNAVWAMLIWKKLDGTLASWSWWGVFSPTLFNHALHIPMQIVVLLMANWMVFKQIGPPPPLHASPGLVLQYAIIHHVRVRSHRVDWANNALESAAVFIVKCLFCDALSRGTLDSVSMRLMFTPIWACWVMTVALLCLKDRTERMFGSSRDLFFIFLLFVAFKVDDQSSISWRVVFLVPWMWFSGLLLVAALVFLLLLFAKVWARPRELALPIGFMLLLLSTLPQFLSYIALVRRLDGDEGTSVGSILGPNALSWLLMWLSGLLIVLALRQKEAVRDALLARGAVWTAHEAVARRLHAERDDAQRRVDELSEDEVSRLVESMMAGKTKPGRLKRVGENLYKRIASLEPALAEQAAQNALAAASEGSATGQPPRPSASGADLTPSAADLRRTAAATAGADGPSPATGPLPAAVPLARPMSAGVGGGGPLMGLRRNRVVPTTGRGAGSGAGPESAAFLAGRPAVAAATDGVPGATGADALPATAAMPTAPGVMVPVGTVPPQAAAALARGSGGGGGGGGIGGSRISNSGGGVPEGGRTLRGSASGDGPPGAFGLSSTAGQSLELQRLSPGRGPRPGGPVNAPAPDSALTAAQRPVGANGNPDTLQRPQQSQQESSPAVLAHMGRPSGCPRPRLSPSPSLSSQAPQPLPSAPPLGRPTSLSRGDAGARSAALRTREADASPAAGALGTATAQPSPRPVGPDALSVAARASLGVSAATSGPPRGAAAHLGRTAAAAGPGPGPGQEGLGPVGVDSDIDAELAAGTGPGTGSPAVGSAGSRPLRGGEAGAATGSQRRSPATLPAAEADSEGGAGPMAGAPEGRGEGAAADPAGESESGGDGVDSTGEHGPAEDPPGGAAAAALASAAAETADELENACVICYDAEASCVFLECGHGGFCRRCAFLLFVRPPNECPTCRSVIDQVVEIEGPAPVGQVARVK